LFVITSTTILEKTYLLIEDFFSVRGHCVDALLESRKGHRQPRGEGAEKPKRENSREKGGCRRCELRGMSKSIGEQGRF
jgi:hypothetical protein